MKLFGLQETDSVTVDPMHQAAMSARVVLLVGGILIAPEETQQQCIHGGFGSRKGENKKDLCCKCCLKSGQLTVLFGKRRFQYHPGDIAGVWVNKTLGFPKSFFNARNRGIACPSCISYTKVSEKVMAD